MPHIHHEILIGSYTEKVYNALTSQEGLAAWWTPGTSAKPEVNSIARFAFGPDYFKEMQITELQPFERVSWKCVAGAGEWIGATLSFTLKAVDKHIIENLHPEIRGQMEQQNGNSTTLLSFQHNNWKAYTAMFAECNYTWALFLRSLKWYCETGRGTPWPFQHRS